MLLDLIEKYQNLPFSKVKGMMILKTGLRGNTIDAYIRELDEGGIIEWNNEKRNYTSLLSANSGSAAANL